MGVHPGMQGNAAWCAGLKSQIPVAMSIRLCYYIKDKHRTLGKQMHKHTAILRNKSGFFGFTNPEGQQLQEKYYSLN